MTPIGIIQRGIQEPMGRPEQPEEGEDGGEREEAE